MFIADDVEDSLLGIFTIAQTLANLPSSWKEGKRKTFCYIIANVLPYKTSYKNVKQQ